MPKKEKQYSNQTLKGRKLFSVCFNLFFFLLCSSTVLVITPVQAQIKSNIDSIIAHLRAAETAVEEAQTFKKLKQQSISLGFMTLDATGERLCTNQERWWKKLHAVDFKVDGQMFRHEMIDPKNIFILTGRAGPR